MYAVHSECVGVRVSACVCLRALDLTGRGSDGTVFGHSAASRVGVTSSDVSCQS